MPNGNAKGHVLQRKTCPFAKWLIISGLDDRENRELWESRENCATSDPQNILGPSFGRVGVGFKAY